jgi:hypothetical protein
MHLSKENNGIRISIRIFESMFTCPGPKLSEAYIAIESGKFRGIRVKQTERVQPKTGQQFFLKSCQ